MGTASTMASLVEALGMCLPGTASIPAVDAERARAAAATGARALGGAREELRPSPILTAEAFDNAVTLRIAIGGGTHPARHVLAHRGPAVVFEDIEDVAARIDDPALGVTAESVLVLRNAGPKGGPGMPEWGQLPIPKKLLAQGVTDLVRISDARMSGTAFGTVVLHVAPEAAAGGPLRAVQDGDPIVLDVDAQRLDVDIPAGEIARGLALLGPIEPR